MIGNRIVLAKALAFIIGATGLIVAVGWLLDIAVLQSIVPGWPSMKLITAVSFILSGILLWSVADAQLKKGASQVIVPVASLALLLIVTTLLISALLGIQTGTEKLLAKEQTSGRPSYGTLLNFMLIGIAGLCVAGGLPVALIRYLAIGLAVIGSIAVAGYALDFPALYWAVQGVSNAMALHTALLFILAGIALLAGTPGRPQ